MALRAALWSDLKTNAYRWAWMGIALCGQTGFSAAAATQALPHLASDEAREVAFLVGKGTAESLATASLLAHMVETRRESDAKPDSTAFIRRAAALAPDRPEIIWLLLRDCQLRSCTEEQSIVDRLQATDPGNGIALLSALKASQAGPAPETTRIIAQIGASKTLTLYWNQSLVMMFDAMTHTQQSRPATALTHDADDRLTHAVGVLTAIDVPPFKPVASVCHPDQLQEAGRRTACESLMARLDASDSIIAQSLSVSVQLKWWPSGSAEATALQRRRLQLEYLVQAAGRVREGQVNADAELRIAAMRHASAEDEADRAVLTAFHEPLVRPAEWHTPSSDQGP